MDVSIIFSAVFFLIAALGAYKGYTRAKKKGVRYSVTRFFIILLSALISVFIARAVAGKLSSVVYGALADGNLPEQITEILSDLPSAPAVILALVSMIIAPILFYPVNSVITLILKILAPFVTPPIISLGKLVSGAFAKKEKPETEEADSTAADAAAFSSDEATEAADTAEELEESDADSADKKSKKAKKQKRARTAKREQPSVGGTRTYGGAAITFGILAGVLSVLIFFAPIFAGLGIIGMIEDTVSEADAFDLGEAAPVMDTVHCCTHNAAIAATNAIGGKLMFNTLTTFKVNGEKITLYNEAQLLCEVAKAALSISSEEKTPEEKAEALDCVLPIFDKSAIIPVLASEFLAGASAAWEKGESFCTIAPPADAETPAHDVMLEAISLFKNSTADTVKEDVGTVVKIAAVIVRNDIVGNMPENPMELLENRALISDLFFEIFENGRLKVLVNSLVNTGIEMMTGMLNVPETLDGVHGSLIAELGAVSAEDEAALKSSLDSVFRRYGIDITSKSLSEFALLAMSVCGTDLSSLSESDIKALLTGIEINGKDTVKEVNISSDAGFRESTLLVTTKYIESVHGTASADSRAEANALADVFASLSDVTDLFSDSDAGVASTVKSLGTILDKLASCSTIGKRCVDSIVVALLQSDTVYDTVHMDKVSSTHFANSIIEGTENGSYSEMMSSIANVIEAMTKTTSSDGLDKDSVVSVISSLTPEVATALGHLVSDNLVSAMGFGGQTAEGVSGILTSVFDNIASAKSEGMDDSTYAEESKKIAEIIDVTMSISGNPSSDVDIDSYVDSVMDSTIITSSLCESVYADGEDAKIDPLGTGMNLSENDKSALVENLQERISAQEGEEKDEAVKNAKAIAAYLNVKVEFIDGQLQIQE